MSLNSTLVFLGTGFILSKYFTKSKYPIVLPLAGMFSMHFLGSFLEFDALVSQQRISKKKIGYWVIGSGTLCAGLSLGNFSRKYSKKLKKSY